ncbi:PA2169 family four-helix-bundle protein [Sporocytophaga myxococcoides]|uniref:PA2169 family four-helix-bundle protein n=1 Tax=Sporocytophaga myxococcoides TaxID=153721 RepID=UPI000491F58D|nr:PA2169 family four-helix-bundle protein [Sporocytophaga myxococcoides]
MKETFELVSGVNSLIRTLNDRFSFFKELIKMTENKAFQSISNQNCDQSKALQKELVKYSDETPEEAGTSFSGDSKRFWIKLKDNITGSSLNTLFQEAVKIEKNTLKEYQEILALNLPSDLKDLISTQYFQIETNYKELILLEKEYSDA